MSSVNKVVLIGNLGKDPETQQTSSGQTLARFSLATSERWTDREGNRQERTEWHHVKAWGSLGEQCERFLRAGRKVYIEGRLESREITDQQTGQNRRFWNIVADEVIFLDARVQGGDR